MSDDPRTKALLERLRALAGDLEVAAAAQRARDPLFEGHARLETADEAGGTRVKLAVTYLSGGGEETATALEDAARLLVRGDWAHEVELCRAQEVERLGSVEEARWPDLERRIRRFLSRPLGA